MSDFIFVQDPKLNNDVADVIYNLREQLIRNFNPKSIILIGSFGRGEASVFKSGCNLKFLSDCEVLIIPNNHLFNQMVIKKFCSNFLKDTGLEITIGGVLISIYLSSSFLTKKLRPTIGNFDLKYGSKVIYGFNYLDQIADIEPNDIPIWEGIRLMLNRIAEALAHFSLEKPDEDMFFWANKIILANQDALLILYKNYDSSYSSRNNLFKKILPTVYFEIYNKYPSFLSLSVLATEYKLGQINMYREDLIDFWFEITEITDFVFRYIIKKEMGLCFDSYVDFQKKYLNHRLIRNSYYRGLVSWPIYQNINSIIKSLIFRDNILNKNLIFNMNIPWNHIIYSCIPILYFSLSKQGIEEKKAAERLNEILSIFSCHIEDNYDSLELFECHRGLLLHLWHRLCY